MAVTQRRLERMLYEKFKKRHPEADELRLRTMVALVVGDPRLTARRAPDEVAKIHAEMDAAKEAALSNREH